MQAMVTPWPSGLSRDLWGSLRRGPGPGATGSGSTRWRARRGLGECQGLGCFFGAGSAVLPEVTAVGARAHLGTGEPQAPVAFSPCGLDWGWEPPAWRPVSCQEDVLSSRPAPALLHPSGASRDRGGGVGGGGVLEAKRLPPGQWVPAPSVLPASSSPWTRMQRTEAPSPAPGVFQDRLWFPRRVGGELLQGTKARGGEGKWGAGLGRGGPEATAPWTAAPIPLSVSCPERAWARVRGKRLRVSSAAPAAGLPLIWGRRWPGWGIWAGKVLRAQGNWLVLGELEQGALSTRTCRPLPTSV